MKIGVPKEIKIHEYRVGLVPAGVRELVDSGHQVLVQSGAGAGIGFDDAHYQAAGASISRKVEDIFGSTDLIVDTEHRLVVGEEWLADELSGGGDGHGVQ